MTMHRIVIVAFWVAVGWFVQAAAGHAIIVGSDISGCGHVLRSPLVIGDVEQAVYGIAE